MTSVGGAPSISASTRPAWRTTWVLAVFFIIPPSAMTSGSGSRKSDRPEYRARPARRSAARPRERTQRFR